MTKAKSTTTATAIDRLTAELTGGLPLRAMERMSSACSTVRSEGVKPEVDIAYADALWEVWQAILKAVEAGVNPLGLAEAIAGGESAAGNMMVWHAGEFDPDIGHWQTSVSDFFDALTPTVRDMIVDQLPLLLTAQEIARLRGTPQFGAQGVGAPAV